MTEGYLIRRGQVLDGSGAPAVEADGRVKGQAIWVSSARAWMNGANRDPILVYPAWALINAQDRAALHVMGRL